MPDAAPYPGPLKEGDRGPAVVAVQGALQAWSIKRHKTHPEDHKLRLYGPTGDWLHPTTLQVGHFQQLHSIPVTNTFGPHTHNALAQWYTLAGRKRLVELERERKLHAYHALLVQWALAISGKRNDWVYTQGPRRMDLLNRGGDPSIQRNVHGDCSSTVAALIHLAAREVGLPDPDLSPWPTTFTMVDKGHAVSSLLVHPGDRVHYGSNTHVGLYIGHPRVPVLSFGGEPGPEPRALFYRPIYACRRDIS